MVQKLRETLLTRYIGSILIALLCSQALIVLIEKIAQTIFWVINDQRSHSALEPSHSSFAWDNLIFSAVTCALYLVVAYVLAQWLYPTVAIPSPQSDDELSPDQPE
jgi:uncharacterized membrane protein (DUF4010 family)